MKKYSFYFLVVLVVFLFSNSVNAAYYRYQANANPGDIAGHGDGGILDSAHAHWVSVSGQAWSIGDAVAKSHAYDTNSSYPAPQISVESWYGAGTQQGSDYGFCDGSMYAYAFCYAGNGMASAYVIVSW